MLDARLVASINTGRCFALVGSGPSCEMGYPSWGTLASKTFEYLESNNKADDIAAYKAYLTAKTYPEFFKLAAYDIGGKSALCKFLKQLLVPAPGGTDVIYDLLARWPFACYLTTNYDDEIHKHLEAAGHNYVTRRHRPEDFAAIRHDTTGLIVKLHGDLDHPTEAVLTSDDYHQLGVAPTGDYFRSKLRSIMEMFDVCIVGHSLGDQDLRLILEAAKDTSSPHHPSFMITADMTRGQQREYYVRYNIVVVPYDNPDGHHSQLKRIFTTSGKYIASRDTRGVAVTPSDPKEIEAATALLLFRRLQTVRVEGVAGFFSPLVLQALGNADVGSLPLQKLCTMAPVSMLRCGSDLAAVTEVIEKTIAWLSTERMVTSEGDTVSLTSTGKDRFQSLSSIRELEREQALGQFGFSLRRLFPEITADELVLCNSVIEATIVEVFRSRGLAIASALFADRSAAPDELADIFATVSKAVVALPEGEIRSAFIQGAYEVLLQPDEAQKRYLTALSQGYFLYHMVGLDPTCSKLRREVFRNTVWLCDSNFVLPLLAQGCGTHSFAADLFERLRNKSAKLFITRRMLHEVWEHLQWAARFVRSHKTQSPTFLAAALGAPGYEQNFFLDGFIRLCADGRVTSFDEYLGLVCGKRVLESHLGKQVLEAGIAVKDLELTEGFVAQDADDVEQFADYIKRDRQQHSTYRSDEQVEAEAEVLQLISGLRGSKYRLSGVAFERVYFLSNSVVLDRVSEGGEAITWTPEASYRYLISLPGVQPVPELLQECMLHSYHDVGVNAIDRERYTQFFSSYIRAAALSLPEEKDRYHKMNEAGFRQDLDKEFQATPDLEKPLLVHKIGLRILAVAEAAAREATQRAEVAERKLRILLEEQKKGWRKSNKKRENQVFAEARNKEDAKHVKKRERQKKKATQKKRRK